MASWRLRKRGSSGAGRHLHRGVAVVGGGLLLATSLAASSAAATGNSICVGHRSGCYATIQAAVDAARDGDTIRIGRARSPVGSPSPRASASSGCRSPG
jgi:hypothetical protein